MNGQQFLLLILIIFLYACKGEHSDKEQAEEVFISDINFPSLSLARCVEYSGKQTASELVYLDCRDYEGVVDTTGLEKFTNLRTLLLPKNKQPIVAFDLSALTNLEVLAINDTQLEALDLSNNTMLKDLTIHAWSVEDVDLSGLTFLEKLDLKLGTYQPLNFSKFIHLRQADFVLAGIYKFDFRNHPSLEKLSITSDAVEFISLSGAKMLLEASFSTADNTIQIEFGDDSTIEILKMETYYYFEKVIDLHGLRKLKSFSSGSLGTTELDFTDSLFVESIDIFHSLNLETLTLPKTNTLKKINLGYSNIKYLDISQLDGLEEVSIQNKDQGFGAVKQSLVLPRSDSLHAFEFVNGSLGHIDVSQATALSDLNLSDNQLEYIDLSANSKLEMVNLSNNNLIDLDISSNDLISELGLLANNNFNCESAYQFRKLAFENIAVSIGSDKDLNCGIYAHIEDEAFANCLSEQYQDPTKVISFSCQYVRSYAEVWKLPILELATINCNWDKDVLDFSQNVYLKSLTLNNCNVGQITLPESLTEFTASKIATTSLDFSKNTENLETIIVTAPRVNSLLLPQSKNIKNLSITGATSLLNLDISGLDGLISLDVEINPDGQVIVSKDFQISNNLKVTSGIITVQN